jgi:hypothetical protein
MANEFKVKNGIKFADNTVQTTAAVPAGTVTSVTAGNGMTQTGVASVNPTLNIVSHAGTAGSIGTINIGVDAIGVNLGTTSTTAYPGNNPSGFTTNTGTVTSVGGTGTVSGLTLSGTVTTTGNLTLGGTFSSTTSSLTDITTVGRSFATLTNPSAISFPQISATNVVTAVSAATFLTSIGAYAASNPSSYIPLTSVTNAVVTGKVLTGYTAGTNTALAATDTILEAMGKIQGQITARGVGTVTSVGGTGTVSGLTLSGTVTTTGNLTLGGTLAIATTTKGHSFGAASPDSTNWNLYTEATSAHPAFVAYSGTTGQCIRCIGNLDFLTFYAGTPGAPTGQGNIKKATSGAIYLSSNAGSSMDWAAFYNSSAYALVDGYSGTVHSVNSIGKVVTEANILRPFSTGLCTLGDGTRRWGEIFTTQYVNVSSDQRLKDNIQDVEYGLDFILSLKPKSYTIKDADKTTIPWSECTDEQRLTGTLVKSLNPTNDTEPYVDVSRVGVRTHLGFLAQDVRESLNNDNIGVWSLADKNDPDSLQALRYEELIAPMTKAIQELSAKLDALSTEFAAYKASHP